MAAAGMSCGRSSAWLGGFLPGSILERKRCLIGLRPGGEFNRSIGRCWLWCSRSSLAFRPAIAACRNGAHGEAVFTETAAGVDAPAAFNLAHEGGRGLLALEADWVLKAVVRDCDLRSGLWIHAFGGALAEAAEL